MIGQRLRLARASSGLSLRDLGAAIDNIVSAQALSKYEHDEMMPSSPVLMALAKALGVSVGYLMSPHEIVLEDVEFRCVELSMREQAKLQARVIEGLGRYLSVEDLLQVSSLEWRRPPEAPFPVSELPEADRAARSVRAHWQLGLEPLPNFAEFLEEKGIKILLSEMPPAVDGLMGRVSWRGRAQVPVIVVNDHEWVSGERERFTLAHELGHLVLECRNGIDREKAASRFAGALLMPAEVLWAEVGKQRSSLSVGELLELKRVFGASMQMLTYRCRDLKIIDEELFRELFREFKERGWRDPPYGEPLRLPKELPRRFTRLCYRALAEGAISESKAAELLGSSVKALDEQMKCGEVH